MRLGFMPLAVSEIGYLPAELAVTIQNRIAVRTRFRKCLPQLLLYPGAGRVFRDIEMDDLAPTVFDDEETIQDSEGEGRHGEEVHGHDHIAVIAKESCPQLAGLVTRSTGAGDSEKQCVRRRRSRVSEAPRALSERPKSDSPLPSSGSQPESRHRSLACQDSLFAIESARTDESRLDASRQRFPV